MADKIHFLPVNPEFVTDVIEKERPDAILLGFGGQTALNCGVGLSRMDVLSKYGVKVLGTQIRGIEITEDRELFKETMLEIGVACPKSRPAYSVEEAHEVVKEIGYPVIMRVAYTLGGRGGGVARNERELDEIVQRGLNLSIAHQVLIEEYIGHWKQIEYEVMRDSDDNGQIVCNMENVLSMRVHTGDNIVVAPSQTITNREYHMLRSLSLKAARRCGIVGECNMQFALEPQSETYRAIEINARLSRSSALASKATGYPIAYIAAKICLGYSLTELKNKVTGVTTAMFEPSLDYVVLKMPRWDTKKFEGASRGIGTAMKSIGEVMAIGRGFEEAIQKAARMLNIRYDGVIRRLLEEDDLEVLRSRLRNPTDQIIFDVVEALMVGIPEEEVAKLSVIDPWFVSKLKNIVDAYRRVELSGREGVDRDPEVLLEAKRLGFSDKQVANAVDVDEDDVRAMRERMGITPKVKAIDTLAAEWPARTNYLYVTYNASTDDAKPSDKRKVIVLGAGPYRIGSSVEFDWGTMNMAWALKESGKVDEIIVVNCNPETVSTDFDMSDRLYFEELTAERVLSIYEREKPMGAVLCVGGQTPNDLAIELDKKGVNVMGTSADSIERAEDRERFAFLLDKIGIPQPEWGSFRSMKQARQFCDKVGYPVIVRPSHVLSGSAMRVIWGSRELESFLVKAAEVNPNYPVTISKFSRGREGDRGRRRLRRGDDGHRGDNGARPEGGRPLGGRDNDHTHGLHQRGREVEDTRLHAGHREGAGRQGAVQHPVPLRQGRRRGDRVQPPRLEVAPVRLQGDGREPDQARRHRDPGREAGGDGRRPRAQAVRGQGAAVLVHADGGRGAHGRGGDALDGRGGVLRRHPRRGDEQGADSLGAQDPLQGGDGDSPGGRKVRAGRGEGPGRGVQEGGDRLRDDRVPRPPPGRRGEGRVPRRDARHDQQGEGGDGPLAEHEPQQDEEGPLQGPAQGGRAPGPVPDHGRGGEAVLLCVRSPLKTLS